MLKPQPHALAHLQGALHCWEPIDHRDLHLKVRVYRLKSDHVTERYLQR